MPRAATASTIVLALALLISYAYFYQAGGWNQNSRFALVRAILERHTLQIDAYHLHTGDRALVAGHYYSDKAPGTALLALAPVAAARGIARLAGVDPESFPGIAWTSYVATVSTAGLFTMIAALVVWRLAQRWGYSRGAALFAATAYGIASPAWCYATLYMGHALAAGALMLAFASAIDLAERAAAPPRAFWIVGFWVGCSVLAEFPAAVPSLFIITMAALARRTARADLVVSRLLWIGIGGAVWALCLFLYNGLAFGSPLHLGYASEEGFAELHTGLFGISYPQWWRIRELLVGSYRGLLPLDPLAALAPFGLLAMARSRERRSPALVALSVPVFYLLLNASYYYWEGGWAYATRHLVPALPFLALGLAPLWDAAGRAGRAILCAAWLWGAALTLVAVSTTPQPPSPFTAPVQQLLWPAFRDGDLSLNDATFVHSTSNWGALRHHQVPHAAWNLGEIAGLHGHASLAPLALVWLVAAILLWRDRSPAR